MFSRPKLISLRSQKWLTWRTREGGGRGGGRQVVVIMATFCSPHWSWRCCAGLSRGSYQQDPRDWHLLLVRTQAAPTAQIIIICTACVYVHVCVCTFEAVSACWLSPAEFITIYPLYYARGIQFALLRVASVWTQVTVMELNIEQH